MQKKKYAVTIVIILMCIISASISVAGDSSDKLVVYTVNYPLKYFAERIGGEHAEVMFPAPAGVDPAYWIPERKTIAEYQKADLILLNGAHYARWIEKVTLPQSRMVNTSGKFRDRYIKLEKAITHSHGPGGEHAHEDAAFTIWLDFDLAVQQAKAIGKAFTRMRPDLESTFKQNYYTLRKDFMDLDSEMKKILSKGPSKPLILSPPVYDYLSRRYGLNVRSVHWEPDKPLSGEQWMELKKILRDHPAEWMIWEGKPLNEKAEKLQSIGIKSVVFDPCGNTPDKGDFLTVMKQNVENLKVVFQ